MIRLVYVLLRLGWTEAELHRLLSDVDQAKVTAAITAVLNAIAEKETL